MLKKISIRTKFLLMGIIMAMAILIQVLGNYYSKSKSDHINSLYITLKQYHLLVFEMHETFTSIISTKNLPPEFYQTGSFDKIHLFDEYAFQTKNQLDEILQSNFVRENENLLNQLEFVIKNHEKYAQNVSNVFEKTKERGEYIYGLYGQLQRSAAELDSIRTEIGYTNDQRFNDIQNEMSLFIGNKDILYYDQFKKNIAEIKKEVFGKKNTISYEQMRFLDATSDFENKFDLFVLKELEIGSSNKEGLKGDVLKTLQQHKNNIAILEKKFLKELDQNETQNTKNTLIGSLVLVIIILSYLYVIEKRTVVPAQRLNKLITDLSLGKNVNPEKYNIEGDFAQTARQLTKHVLFLAQKQKDLDTLRNKEYEKELHSKDKNDATSQSIIALQNQLQTDWIKQHQIEEHDKIQDWITGGLAKFGDILRVHADNINKLSTDLLKELIEYVDVQIGGFFVFDEPQGFLTLSASYAYDKEKILQKKIKLYEGLIGTCAVDRKTLYLPDAPENYMKISSGSGETPPTNLLIVPMVSNERLAGVLELASLEIIDDYKIDFIERLAEDIADTLLLAKINERNGMLLSQYQHQSVEMKKTEEKLNDKILILEGEIKQKQLEIFDYLNQIRSYNFLTKIEVDENGEITSANDQFIMRSGFSKKQMIGKPVYELFNNMSRMDFNIIWTQIHSGAIVNKEEKIKRREKTFWFNSLYVGIFDVVDNLNGIMIILTDISEIKESEDKLTNSNIQLKTEIINLNDKLNELSSSTQLLNQIIEQKNKIIHHIHPNE